MSEFTGQAITVEANEPVQLGTIIVNDLVLAKAHPDNSAIVYVGGDVVVSGTGFPLSAGDSVEIYVGDLKDIYITSPSSNQRVSWIKNQV